MDRGLPEDLLSRAAYDFAVQRRFSRESATPDIADQFVESARSSQDKTEVARRLGRVAASQPDNKDACLNHIRALADCGRYPEAMTVAKSAIGRFPRDVVFLAQAAHIASALTDFATALAFARQAWALDNNHAFAFQTMHSILREVGHVDELRDFLERHLEHEKFSAPARGNLKNLPHDLVGLFEKNLPRIATAIRDQEWVKADTLIRAQLSAAAADEVGAIMGGRAFRQKMLFLVFRLRVFEEFPDPHTLDEISAFEAGNQETILDQKRWPQEANTAAAFYFLLGKACSASPEDAKRYFSLALTCDESFFPARIWLSALEQEISPPALFAALGVSLPHEGWKYRLAASLLGIHPDSVSSRSAADADCAICIRGLWDANTPLIVRYYRHHYPDARIIVSVWSDTDPSLIAAILPYADRVLPVPAPKVGGFRNTNRQIAHAYTALSEAEKMSAKTALLVRTDFVLFRPRLIEQLTRIVGQRAERGNAGSPLVIADAYTRKWIPRHPSDMIMFGRTEDMLGFWSAAWQTSDRLDLPLHETHPEVYLSRAYLEFRNHPVGRDGHLDWLSALGELFVVKSFAWFEALWLKHPHLRNTTDEALWLACMSEAEWETIALTEAPSNTQYFSRQSHTAVFDDILGLPKF